MKPIPVSVILLCLAAPVAWPSNTAAVQQNKKSDEALTLATDLVVLDAQVVSKKTHLAMPGLTANDLALFEDGVRQQLSYFSQDSLPLSVLLLLDVSASIAPNFPALQRAASAALESLKHNDEVALMVFGGSARVVQGFTTDKQRVALAIAMADATGLRQGTDVTEAVYAAALHLEKAAAPGSRKIIIAITDDQTSSNIITPRPDVTAIRTLHETRTTVCGLLFRPPFKRIGGEGFVRNFAEATGGVVVSAESKKLGANLEEIIGRHLRTRYSLGYMSKNEKRDGSFRKIKLEASPEAIQRVGPLEIVTRKGYYTAGLATDQRGKSKKP